LLAGAGLIVAGGIALARERVRPADFRRLGVLFAVITTVLFAIRDNVLRSYAKDTHVHALVAAPVSLLAGAAAISLYLVLTRGSAWSRGYTRQLIAFLPGGLLFGASYLALFGAYYRGGVSVVNPLVATESLWGVAFSLLLLRRSELVGRWLVLGAALVVAGGALIGVSR
jgi:drug/metabolite transporter (DMT)-like permease